MRYRTLVIVLARAFAASAWFAVLGCQPVAPDASAMSTGGALARSPREGLTASVDASSSPAGVMKPSSAGDMASDSIRPPNHMGRIPVLEYHVIGGSSNALYRRTIPSFRADLEDVYRRGYRPITISQMLDKDFREVPVGMSPIVFVFDDASPEQLSYVEKDGKLEIDSTSAVGIWLDFARTHPGWKNRAVFCLLNGAGAGHNFFGDGPQWRGQRREWRFEKVRWLADNGFELCAHTLWHAKLSKYPDAVVQEQIARNVMGIDSAVAGYKVRTFALPYGLWPRNRELAWKGSWIDSRTGKAHAYSFDAVLEVTGGPTLSPFDPLFNPHSITRTQAIGDDIRRMLDRLDAAKSRFVR